MTQDIQGSWVLLGELAAIRKGEQKSRRFLKGAGQYPVINGGVEPSGYTDDFNANANTITISEGGNSCGYVSLQTKSFWLGGHCYAIEPTSPNVYREYLYWALKGSQPSIMALRVGSGLPNVQKSALEGFRVWVPSDLAEQRRIAAALSAADDVVQGYRALIAKKELVKSALMSELLSGERRLPGFTGEWITNALGNICRLYQPATIAGSKFTDAGFPVYGANGQTGHYSEWNHATWQTTIACRGTCGKVNRTSGKAWINGNAMVANVDANSAMNKTFFYYLMAYQDFTDAITGSGIPQIVRGSLSPHLVRFPRTLAEQEQISKILSTSDTEIESLKMSLDKSILVRDALQSDLLSGRRRL